MKETLLELGERFSRDEGTLPEDNGSTPETKKTTEVT
jgi:hypothetical protein